MLCGVALLTVAVKDVHAPRYFGACTATHPLKRPLPGKRYLLGIGLTAALVASALAIARASLGSRGSPLRGLESASDVRSAPDAVDQETAARVRAGDQGHDQIGTHLLSESRAVGSLPDGRKVFVLPTSKGRLCVLVERLAKSCGAPLTGDAPVTFTIVDVDGPGGEGPLAYGVARDDVVAVSFTVAGRVETVAVENNMFVFRGSSSDQSGGFSALTVRLADGSSVAAG